MLTIKNKSIYCEYSAINRQCPAELNSVYDPLTCAETNCLGPSKCNYFKWRSNLYLETNENKGEENMYVIENKIDECQYAHVDIPCPFETKAKNINLSGTHACLGRDCPTYKPIEQITVKGLNHNPVTFVGDEHVGSDSTNGSTHNPVEHPNHYCQGGIECIKAIEAAMPPEGFQDYCKGNILKYIWRWRDKAGVEDLKKAKVYLEWLIESATAKEH